MKHLKKTLLTLVALIALTTQAWATDVSVVGNGEGNWLNGVIWDPGAPENKMTEQNGVYSITFTDVDANKNLQFKFAINGSWAENYGCSSTTEIILNKTNSNIEALGDNIMFELTEPADVTISFNLSELTYMISTKGMKVGDDIHPVPLTRGTDDKINEWTLTNGMPAGNVTVSVEYFPQATMADGAVTAATDVKATTDAPLVTVDPAKLTGAAKMMYYVSTEATAPAYDAEGWTDVLPTAEKFTEAANLNVWYYPVGTDNGVDGATATYSDGDMNATALAVTLLPEPTYNVTFAEGVNPEPPADPIWTATPNTGVKKGDKVTVTYTGERKVIGVKAEKKTKVYTMAADATAEDKGKLICADGHIHAYNKDAECTAARVAKIIYLGTTGHATYTHGLALALEDVSSNSLSWDNSRSNNNSMTAAEWCSACNTSKAVTGATWLLASKDQWDYMLGANGAGSYTALRDGFTSVGGTNMQTVGYWSSTEDSSNAWIYGFGSGSWYSGSKDSNYNVRACIAF